jgi:hypothetical protein
LIRLLKPRYKQPEEAIKQVRNGFEHGETPNAAANE